MNISIGVFRTVLQFSTAGTLRLTFTAQTMQIELVALLSRQRVFVLVRQPVVNREILVSPRGVAIVRCRTISGDAIEEAQMTARNRIVGQPFGFVFQFFINDSVSNTNLPRVLLMISVPVCLWNGKAALVGPPVEFARQRFLHVATVAGVRFYKLAHLFELRSPRTTQRAKRPHTARGQRCETVDARQCYFRTTVIFIALILFTRFQRILVTKLLLTIAAKTD